MTKKTKKMTTGKSLDRDLERMRDKPAGTLPQRGQSSVAQVPAYYHTQTAAQDTKSAYRFAAAGRGKKG